MFLLLYMLRHPACTSLGKILACMLQRISLSVFRTMRKVLLYSFDLGWSFAWPGSGGLCIKI